MSMNFDLRQELQRFGALSDSVKLFDKANASVVRYIDLLPENAARGRGQGCPLPAGVVEYGNQPLLYVVRADFLTDTPRDDHEVIGSMLRSLACRGEGDYIGLIKPGEITVYPITLSKHVPKGMRVGADDARAPLLVQDLAGGIKELGGVGATEISNKQQAAHIEALHRLLFKLLTGVSDAMRASQALSISRDHDQVLPLVGRALFTRFLVDRGIINDNTFPDLYRNTKPELCYSTPELAAKTCAWLDDKFNGELLPLFQKEHATRKDYQAFFTVVHHKSDRVLHELSNIMYRAPDGKLSLDLDWGGIDFAHVPVGLLSEVYEDYAHRFYKDDALRESVRYTPKHIAEFTVSQAFEGIAKDNRHRARLLDPAAGAGIFLVLAFQRLVRERWEATGKRPQTNEIREILYRQIRGFDINGSALTLSALSLYLTALELDPNPYPPEKLRFEPLLDNVLFNMREKHEQFPYDRPVFGSLGRLGAAPEHLAQYDIVIGNAPWTAWKGEDGKAFNKHITEMVRAFLSTRANIRSLVQFAMAYVHNDMLPDTAFLWRAQQWAKPNGVIALIVHGRLMFKRAERGADVRAALFRSMRVTGVLNGSELMRLWPSLNQPFCIVFARNEVPKPSDRFRFVTPELDTAPGSRFRMRIDHESAQPIETSLMLTKPYLLKSIFRGGRLDIELVDRLYALTQPEPPDLPDDEDDNVAEETPTQAQPYAVRIGDMWGDLSKLQCGQGFFPGKEKTTEHLLELNGKQFTTDDDQKLHIDTSRLHVFNQHRLKWPRRAKIYLPPLVLVSESPGEDRYGIRARVHLGKKPLIYNRSFYGYSTHGHPEAATLASYLFLLANSDLFLYFILQVSAKFGVERRTVFMEDIADFPIIPLERLAHEQKLVLMALAARLSLENEKTWKFLNRWVNDLYGLSSADEQVIRDTLATRMPYSEALGHALSPANKTEVEKFQNTLEAMLQPYFVPTDEMIEVRKIQLPVSTWVAFDIINGNHEATAAADAVTSLAASLADQEGASRIIMEAGLGHLRIAIRNQYRYLTKSRARLCALDVLRSHGSVFPVKDA